MTEGLEEKALDEESLEAARSAVADGLYFGQPQTDPAHTPKGLAKDIAREAVLAYLNAERERGFAMMPREPTPEMFAAAAPELQAVNGIIALHAARLGTGGLKEDPLPKVWRAMFDAEAGNG